MTRANGSFHDLVDHSVHLLSTRDSTLWVGEEVSAAACPSGRRLIRRIARVTCHALSPLIPELPGIDQIVDRLSTLGFELALSLADRTIGRSLPLSLEDPFDGRRPRLPAWESLMAHSFKGQPGYLHRAMVSLARAGHVARIVTANRDALIETAAHRIGFQLPVVEAIEGDLPLESRNQTYLFKFHGTQSRRGSWPLDLHRLHIARDSAAMSFFQRQLEAHPLLVLGYTGPDPLDLGPTLTRSRLKALLWADEVARPFEAERFSPVPEDEILAGDAADRLLQIHGGWRLKGRLGLWLEAVCEALGVDVPGPAWDEEVTALRELDDLWWPQGEEPPLPPIVEPLGHSMREQWVGAFALLTTLDLWSEPALEAIFAQREALERTLPDPGSRAWFRYLLAQTGRSEVEAAFTRYFAGLPVPPTEEYQVHRLRRAVQGLDWFTELQGHEPLNREELDVESRELRFALTGASKFLPAASQVIAELPSITHAERWLRLKAAGAVSRRQWSVAIGELGRALAEAGESGSPLMKLRARVSLAGVLGQLLTHADPTPLMGCLNALKRRDRGLAGQVIDRDSCRVLATALILRLYDESLESYVAVLPTLQPPMEPLLDDYLRLALQAYDEDVAAYLFDRNAVHGRSYAFLPTVEDQLAIRLMDALALREELSRSREDRFQLTQTSGIR